MSSSDKPEETPRDTDFGKALAAARKARKIGCEEVSEQLKIPLRTIEAIEASDVSQLPPPTFTRGYLRAYARYLEIDAAPVLQVYDNVCPPDHHLRPRSRLPRETSSQSPLIRSISLLMLVLVAVAVIYGFYQYYSQKADSVKAEVQGAAGAEHADAADSPVGLKPLPIEQKASLDEEGELVLDTPPAVDSAATLAPAEGDAARATPAPERKPAAPKPVAAARPADVIAFYASKGAWLELHEQGGRRLHYNLIPKGRWVQYEGKAPFTVSLGNARSTQVKINGLDVDLTAVTRPNNTARFRLSSRREGDRQIAVIQ